ncbi:MAG TPA: RNA polymerase sigma factor [Acidimicrobiia bacterium]
MPPIPSLTDREFSSYLRAARAGDEGAWRALYDWLAPQILGFLRSSGLPDPDDVLGDVFLDLARGVKDFKGNAKGFRALVFTIARARRVDEFRRLSRRSEEPLDAVIHDLAPAGSDVEHEALALVALDDLLEILGQLTDDQAEVLVLRALGGWTSREIGEITGRSTGAVEQLQHRATEALRDLLEAP